MQKLKFIYMLKPESVYGRNNPHGEHNQHFTILTIRPANGTSLASVDQYLEKHWDHEKEFNLRQHV